MDSLTQIALGAAVGEAALGRRVGNVAPAWGAVLGTLPDLDVLIYPFVDPVAELALHRGFSHSILFSVLMAPIFGRVLSKLHSSRGGTWTGWSLLAFGALFTHLALDSFTVYGTQVFWPFSDFPVSFDTIFIIDPLYTLPLVAGVLLAIRAGRKGGRRSFPNAVGLALSTAYLAWTVVAKAWIEQDFRSTLRSQGIVAQRIMTNPTPLNSILWMGVAESGDTLWVGLRGLFDDGPADRMVPIPRNSELVADHREDRGVARLAWFSKGWWAVEQTEDGRLFWNDIRFGRNDAWLSPEGEYIFRFELRRSASGSVDSFEMVPPGMRMSGTVLARLARRVTGEVKSRSRDQYEPGTGS